MHVDIALDATDTATGQSFLTWCPVKGHARLTDASGAQAPVSVTLRNGGAPGAGQVVFDLQRTDSGQPQLPLQLPLDGSAVEFSPWQRGGSNFPRT